MADAALMLRELSLPWMAGERMKGILQRTSRLCHLTYWRTSDIWYRKARKIEPYEVVQIAEALRLKRESAAKNELHELKFRLAKLESLLASKDPDFFSPDIDFYREHMREPGDMDRTMAKGSMK